MLLVSNKVKLMNPETWIASCNSVYDVWNPNHAKRWWARDTALKFGQGFRQLDCLFTSLSLTLQERVLRKLLVMINDIRKGLRD